MFNKIILSTFSLFLSCSYSHLQKSMPAADPCPHAFRKEATSIGNLLGLSQEMMKTKTGVLPLEIGGQSFVVRNWLFENAQKTIDIQYYMFLRDNTGLIAAEYLVRAADRGVKIRVIMDDATAKSGSHEIYALDSHENIEIKVYNPGVKLGSVRRRLKKLFTKPWRFHRRMHNKTITVDGEIAITGGRNMANEYFDYDDRYNFRDRDVFLAGKAVTTVSASFEVFWNSKLSVPYSELVRKNKKVENNPARFNRLHQYVCDENNFSQSMKEKVKNFAEEFKTIKKLGEFAWVDNVSFVSDIPGKNENRKNREGGVCNDSLLALIKQAKVSIDIQSSYLILTDEGKKIVKGLVERGVKIRVLTNNLGSTDNNEAFNGYQRDRKEILKTGIDIYEFKPNAQVRFKLMIPEIQRALNYKPVYGHHAKTMVIDGAITVIGSYNVDPRSANLNTECLAIIRSVTISKNVLKHLNEEFLPENSWYISTAFNPDKEAGNIKRIESASRRVFPKKIL